MNDDPIRARLALLDEGCYGTGEYSDCGRYSDLGESAANALRAVLDRLDAVCDAEQLPENRGNAPCPTSMLRVYIHQDIAQALGVEEAEL